MGSIGFSPIAVHKDERIVKAAEYHTTTWEGIVALDDDMIIHVAPASAGAPVPELTRAFIVPKGTMVKINAAIWHLCPLPLNNEVLHAMIILPECTYANDCTVVDFERKKTGSRLLYKKSPPGLLPGGLFLKDQISKSGRYQEQNQHNNRYNITDHKAIKTGTFEVFSVSFHLSYDPVRTDHPSDQNTGQK